MIFRQLTGHRCCCRGCGEFFNSVSAFDWHRATPLSANGTPRLRSIRRCLTVEEMRCKGMSKNASGYWIKEPRTTNRIYPVAGEITAALRHPLVSQRGDTL
jgi:hypothetical protein